MAAIDDLNAAMKTLIADTSTALADISAKLTALAANQTDPNLTAEIEAVVGQVNTLDTSIKAADPGTAPAPAGS